MKQDSSLKYPWAQRWIQFRLRTFFRVSRSDIAAHFACTEKTVTVYLQTYAQQLGAAEGPKAVAWRAGLFLAFPRALQAGSAPYIATGDEELQAWRDDGLIPRSRAEAWAWLERLRGHELLATTERATRAGTVDSGATAGFYPGVAEPLSSAQTNKERPEGDARVFTSADTLRPALNGTTVAMTLQALFLRSRLHVSYRTKSGKETERLFSPHHLVFADNRYHVRAFDHRTERHEGTSRYMDFNLGRITPIGMVGPTGFQGDQDDQEWNTPVTLKFRINDDLPTSLREAVEETYMFSPGQDIPVPTTEALKHYVLREWSQKVFPPSVGTPRYLPYFKVQEIPDAI